MRNRIKYISTGFVLLMAIAIRIFAMHKASEVTIQPEVVEEDTVSNELTDLEQVYVDKFLKRAGKEHDLTPVGYTVERFTTSEVVISISFKETSEVATVRYDPWLDRWSGSITLKGE